MYLKNLLVLFLASVLLNSLPACAQRDLPDSSIEGDDEFSDDDEPSDVDDTEGDDQLSGDDDTEDDDQLSGDDDTEDDDQLSGDDDTEDDDQLSGDDDTEGDDDDTSDSTTDGDADGYSLAVDCDDGDPAVYPGAPEICDGLDNDCDSQVPGDEIDNDGDSFDECADLDCDDSDAAVYPGAAEICDGLDNDCDGQLPASEIEICDGLDNDCDGLVDPPGMCGVTDLLLLDGYDGSLYSTTDAGATWSHAGTAPFSAPAKVAIVNLDDGSVLATTTHGDTWLSPDGGASWTAGATGPWGSDGVPSGSPSNNVKLDAAGSSLFAISTHHSRDGILYESSDAGLNWTQVATWPVQTGMDCDLAASSQGDVYVGHPPYQGAPVYHYDGSSNVLSLAGSYDASSSGGAANLEVDAAGSVIATGNPEVTFVASPDSGNQWSTRGSWSDPRAIGTLVNAGADLYAISVKGPVLRSHDLGLSWTLVGDWGSVATHNIISSSGWIDMVSLP